MTGDHNEVMPGERMKAMAGLEVLLRIWRKAVDCFPDDDLETILVFLTVAAASGTSHLRGDPALIVQLDDTPLPAHLHRPTSGRAVAEATGLARETVRRRLDALVASGRLARDGRGVRTISGTMSHDRNLEFVRFLIRELTAASGRIGRFGPA